MEQTKGDNMDDDQGTITEDAEAEIYPLDVSKLEKGNDITASECERICGIRKADSVRYQFALMALRGWIIREAMAAHRPLSVAMRNGGLHINTDSEASTYHNRLAGQGEQAVRRNLAMLCHAVDAGKMTDQQRADHMQNIKVWSLKVAAMKRAAIQPPEPAAIEAGT